MDLKDMKKLFAFLPFFLCIAACYPKDDYTGEPFLREEFTVNGQHYSWEDWGYLYGGLLGKNFQPNTEGQGISAESINDSLRIAVFHLETPHITYNLTNFSSFFYDGRVYQYQKDTLTGFRNGTPHIQNPVNARIESGWYSFTRQCVEPYDSYVLRFEFDCIDGQGCIVQVRDGIVEMGRRFALQKATPVYPYIVVANK